MEKKYIAIMVAAGLLVGSAFGGEVEDLSAKAARSVAAAKTAISNARDAIKASKTHIKSLSENAKVLDEVKGILAMASDNWASAVAALKEAEKSAMRIAEAKDVEMAKDYARLTSINSGIALSGANVVSAGLVFIEAAASNKTESFGVIRSAIKGARESADQVKISSEKIIGLIEARYAN